MRLDDLLAELQSRLDAVLATRDRVHALLEAVVSIGSDLDLETMLRRLVQAATTLVDASYGALGVIGHSNALVEFVPVGLTDEEIARIAHWPHGLGILGLLIKEPEPLRLADIAEHPESYGFPPGHPPMRTFLGVPIRVRDEVFGNVYLTEKRGGGEFDEDDEIVVVALATAAGVAIENARLYDEGRRREQWLGASSEITRTLLSGTEPGEVLSLVARRAREMTDAGVAVIGMPDGPSLVTVAADGTVADQLIGVSMSIAASVPGAVYRSGDPAVLDDIHADEVLAAAVGDLPLGPCLLVALGARGASRGVLGVANGPGGATFSAATQGMLQAFAGQAAVALELAERRRDVERLVMLEDHDRIAKDLHDVVIQRLFATAMTLMSAGRLIDRPEAAIRVQRAVDDLDETIRQIRTTIFALQAPADEGRPNLRTRLLASVDAAAETLGFTPGVALDGLIDTAVPDDVAEQMLTVLREALTNVARHAQASRVDVMVEVSDQLQLRVEDNGVGIKPGGRRSGLRNLAGRAQAFGGTFDVRAGDGRGTILEWQVPLDVDS